MDHHFDQLSSQAHKYVLIILGVQKCPGISTTTTPRPLCALITHTITRTFVETVGDVASLQLYPSNVCCSLPIAHLHPLMTLFLFSVRQNRASKAFFCLALLNSDSCMGVYISMLWIWESSLTVVCSALCQTSLHNVPHLRFQRLEVQIYYPVGELCWGLSL